MSPLYWGLLAAAGAAGPAGATGETGPQGPTGYIGPQGQAGLQGLAGPTGSQGPQGPTGQTGPQGLQGAAGATGATGAVGPPGTNGTNGAPGQPGMIFRGAWSSIYGYAANDAVTYGTPASTYIALTTNSSTEPDLYPQVWTVLAQAGGVGPTGPTGAAATVAIGTVTTGAPGTQASVTNSGTNAAAVLNFTIPQGASGPPGSGGGGTSSLQGAGVYHSVQNSQNYPYYSVTNPNSSSTESGLTASAYSPLTWMPAACTATALNVFSEQNSPISVTLRVGTSPTSMVSTTLACTSVAKGTSCSATGSVSVSAGSFVDLIISGADSSPMPVWTALACN